MNVALQHYPANSVLCVLRKEFVK